MTPYQQHRTTTPGQLSDTRRAAAAFLADIEDTMRDANQDVAAEQMPRIPTSYRDPVPAPTIGTAPPVSQPGRPAMSQRAVDLNTTILSTSVLTAMLGGAVTGILWASGEANPTVIAWICGCIVAVPAAIGLPVLALKGLMKSAKEVVEAAPPEIHNHFNGTVNVDRRQAHSKNTGFIATNRNDLRSAR
ncbi:hypothetical protein [Streptomyces sp. NBC_00878]|uniref:hypothetical protein n=1 Tax=Streptomyces sp. NBC_00878 TaxID=2975854 RepID=UPI0022519B39|nr:hypothetical protein [Streptomyces sp. NBC_00878]MCX4911817.1 hypothetical protein [Streptomyces sp. NBC_00878]